MSTARGSDIEEAPNWLIASQESRDYVLDALERKEWKAEMMVMPKDEPSLGDERIWCDKHIFDQLREAKRILNEHASEDIEIVRKRSNPHEPLLNNKIMMGRMSLLIASIDRVFDFILTDENAEDAEVKCPLNVRVKGTNIDREREIFYFAESQSMNIPFASQYVIIRKGFYNAKCFIPRSIQMCSPLVSLSLVDTMRRDRIVSETPFNPFTFAMRSDFINLINRGTLNKGVHLYAGFTHNRKNPSIKNKDQNRGDQGQKELLFRDSYVGQLYYASSIVRAGGRACLQFLDTNTSTTVAVVHLASIIFDRVSIYKPNMSRPANAEKKREAKAVLEYLKSTLDEMKPDDSIRRLIPDSIMDSDNNFIEYFTTANNCLAERQHKFLCSYLRMLEDESRENTHQSECLQTCLSYYLIPYTTYASRTSLWKLKKERNAEEIITSLLPEEINLEAVLRRLMNLPSVISSNQLIHKLNGNHRFLMTPCADLYSTLVVATWNGVYYVDRGRFVEWSRDPCILPPETVLIGDFFEFNGGRPHVLRILDVALVFGDNVSNLPFSKRLLAAGKLMDACRKDGVKSQIIFTMANYEKIEKEWKPDSTPRVVENNFHFERAKLRFVEDTPKSFFDLCRGDGVYEMR